MKRVKWTDKYGYRRVSEIRDDDPDSLAPAGVPVDIIDLRKLDWKEIAKELHNDLVDADLYTWDNVQKLGGLPGKINGALKRAIIGQLRMIKNKSTEVKENV